MTRKCRAEIDAMREESGASEQDKATFRCSQLGASMRIHEDYINTHYSPQQVRDHFDSYDYCLAKLVENGWDTARCPREWAIISEHQRRVRDERWKLALKRARELFDEQVAEGHPLQKDPHKGALAILRQAERILCQQMYVPPTFTAMFECAECGTVPARPHSEGCPWCRTAWRQEQIAQDKNAVSKISTSGVIKHGGK